MTTIYKPYPAYKDSGVEWLGEIPEGWKNIRLKNVSKLEGAKTEPNHDLSYVGMENIESNSGKYIYKGNTKPEGVSSAFSAGDVLFGKLRPYLAKSWLATFSGVCSSEFLVLNSQLVSPKFLNYYTLTDEFIRQVDSSTYGSKMPRASWDFISLMNVPVPNFDESKKIANFLDHETARIDTLIAKQKKLIALLKEKRQAVISHAVTKGLNPDVEMKDSGVEWLGEVPAHWSSTRLKFLSEQIVDGAHFTPTYVDEGVPFLRVTDIQEQVIDTDRIKYIPKEEHEVLIRRCKPAFGDLLLSKNGTIGVPKIVDWDWDFSIFVSLCLIKLSKRLNVKYAYYFFLSQQIKEQINGQIKQSTVINLHLDKIQNFYLTLPSLTEQKEISNYLDEHLFGYDLQVKKAEEMNTLLKERRTALISAAVTGKIDLRDWQAPQEQSAKGLVGQDA